MDEQSEFERQREGGVILLDSEAVEYFQLFTAMEDGPVMLSGQRDSADADYGLFLGHLIKILAEHTDETVEQIAEEGVERAAKLLDEST